MSSHMDHVLMYFELGFCKCAKENARGYAFYVMVGINKYCSKLSKSNLVVIKLNNKRNVKF